MSIIKQECAMVGKSSELSQLICQGLFLVKKNFEGVKHILKKKFGSGLSY